MEKIKVGSDFSGVGAFLQSLKRIGANYEESFACDMDEYSRQSYVENYGTQNDIELVKTKLHSAICKKMKQIIEADKLFDAENELFLKEANDFAKQFSFYFPFNVYNRDIPSESVDIYMTSPPCQAFSNAGKRLGKLDKRGILFFNSLEFITVNKPKFFIFENVKGLLSHDKSKKDKTVIYGRTFQEWINYLGGKSVNGNETIFPYEESVPYHIFFKVLNAKHHSVPQNRERIFIIGIRDDQDSHFHWPKPVQLKKRLKDILEPIVDEKYFLSDKMLEYFTTRAANFNAGKINFKDEDSVASAITSSSSSLDISDNIIKEKDTKVIGDLNKGGQKGVVFSEDSKTISCLTATDYKQPKQIEVAPPELNQVGSIYEDNSDAGRIYDSSGISCTIKAEGGGMGAKTGLYEVDSEPQIAAIRGRNPKNPSDRTKGAELEQTLEINSQGISNALTTVNKDNMVVLGYTRDKKGVVTSRHEIDVANTIHTASGGGGNTDQYVMIPSNTNKGFEKAEAEKDSINFQNINSTTRRARVGKEIANTIDTTPTQGVLTKNLSKNQIEKLENLNVDENISGCLTEAIGRAGSSDEYMSMVKRNAIITKRIRRLTPRECFRLMDFPEDYKIVVSDTQAYKQAGNSIVVEPLALLISKLLKIPYYGKKD